MRCYAQQCDVKDLSNSSLVTAAPFMNLLPENTRKLKSTKPMKRQLKRYARKRNNCFVKLKQRSKQRY